MWSGDWRIEAATLLDEYRRAWLARLGVSADPDFDYGAMVEDALDDVASALEDAIDVDALFRTSLLPPWSRPFLTGRAAGNRPAVGSETILDDART